MIVCGIDAGIEYTKIVIVNDGEVMARAKGLSGGACRSENVKTILAEALAKARIKDTDIEQFVITGKGKYNTGLEGKKITELAALESAVRHSFPDASQAVSIGADEVIVCVLSDKKIEEYTLNQKCSAGIGLFLEETGEFLGVDLTQPELAEKDPAVELNDSCAAFAKMDILELLNQNVPKKNVAAAAIRFAAVRTSGVIRDITIPDHTRTVFAGGVCRYEPFMTCMKNCLEGPAEVFEDPVYAMAEGAAYFAY